MFMVWRKGGHSAKYRELHGSEPGPLEDVRVMKDKERVKLVLTGGWTMKSLI
jgi:hypothetical protein